MRRMLLAGVLVGATLFAPGLVPEARAYHEWLAIGTAFRVGAAHVAFVFARPSFAYEPAYFLRFDRPIRYGGHRCGRSCFRDAGYDYHHESCPLVGAHFRHYDVDPSWAFSRYAPRFADGRHGYGDRGRYRDGGRYRDHGRYRDRGRYDDRGGHYGDPHDRHDRDGRYDRRRGRDRGHRHHRGCGHD